MKRSKQVALWLSGSIALTGCHEAPDGTLVWGPSTSGTNTSQGGGGYYSYHSSGWSGWGGSDGEDGISRGGFGSHGGFGGGE